MEPIIYKLPRPDNIIDLDPQNVYFDTEPSPKLIKYGLNNVADPLDMVAITSVPYYKAGLDFNFERKDGDSIMVQAKDIMGVKKIDQTFAEFWEILTFFGFLNNNQNIYTSHEDIVQNIISIYQKFKKTKGNFNISAKKTKGKNSLVIIKYSDTDMEENASIQLIVNDLKDLLAAQTTGASMVLQIFGLQTQTMAEIVYYLSSLYNEAYIMKPAIDSPLFDSRYIILINLRETIKATLPNYPDDQYLISLGLQLPTELETIIQCMNSLIIPRKYKLYYLIKSYLDTRIYEGATYQEMVQNQNDKTNKWLSTFTDIDKLPSILDTVLKNSDSSCVQYTDLMKIIT